MRLVIEKTRQEVGHFTCEYVVERLCKWCEDHQDDEALFGLCLSGRGPVMDELLRKLVAACKSGEISFCKIALFATDEYVGIDPLHPASQYKFLYSKLLQHVDILRENVYILQGHEQQNIEEECERFEDAIRRVGGLQLVVSEIGPSGELGRNVPGSSLQGRTRPKALNYDTVIQVAEEMFDGDISKVPQVALSIGLGTIMDAKEVIALFSGLSKAIALEHCVEKTYNHMWPVSAVQKHPCCLVVCDEPSTMELKVKTVRYFQGLQKTARLDRLESRFNLTRDPSKHRLLRTSTSES